MDEWVRLRDDQQTKSNFATTKGGARFSVGVGGSITGKHGHFIFIDDPMNPEEAVSEVELKASNRWMNETIPTRMVDKRVTPIILIMQRLHQDDPTANMLEKAELGGDAVKHICLPAEESDKIKPVFLHKYYKAGLLDPIRLPRSVLKRNAIALGDYGYAGQFDQHPVPLGGGTFKFERVHIDADVPTRWAQIVRYWDNAATQDGGAFTVGLKMAVDMKGRIWILNCRRGQWDTDKREAVKLSTAQADGFNVQIGIEQEGGSAGKDSIRAAVRNLRGFVVIADKPTGDKEVRAVPFSVQVNEGNVYMVPAPWNDAYLSEMEYFPHSKYKDQIDASSGAFKLLTRPVIQVRGGFAKSSRRK